MDEGLGENPVECFPNNVCSLAREKWVIDEGRGVVPLGDFPHMVFRTKMENCIN